jgi:hypothetical protein
MTVGNFAFAPKGGMCVKCVHRERRCGHLPFHKMKVIEHCKVSNFKIVKCDDYKQSK